MPGLPAQYDNSDNRDRHLFILFFNFIIPIVKNSPGIVFHFISTFSIIIQKTSNLSYTPPTYHRINLFINEGDKGPSPVTLFVQRADIFIITPTA